MGKKLNFWYGSIFGTYWMAYAVICSFASVFLLAKGYSNSQIGVTLAAANVLAVIMQPPIADLADRSSRIGTIGITSLLTVLMMVFTMGMFFLKGGSLALTVVFALVLGWHTVLQPMLNALTFKLEECGVPINFGVARSVGSLAYSALIAVLGTAVERMGITVLPITAEVIFVLLLVSLFFTKRIFDKAMEKRRLETAELESKATDHPAREESSETEQIGLVDFIKRNRLFFVLNLGVIGIFFSNSVLNNYMVQIVMDVGGDSEDMGRILAEMAFLEIPAMVFFTSIKRRFSCELLLKVASVGFTLKILLCWIAGSVGMLFLAQAFQMVSFGLFLPGMVYFTGEIMSRGEAVKGQALFTTMITLTTIFASLLGGWILDLSGAKTLTMISTLATAAGAAVVFLVIDKIGRRAER